jgi:carbon-monoxide dehydrogenase medium subunit
MKPPSFEYAAPTSLQEASQTLADANGDAKILAGGQSLVPMLNFRLLRPTILVDINRIPDLDFISEREGGISIGALTRHHTLETSPVIHERFPIIAEAMHHVAHLAIRNRGTIGGSLSHADPAAELALMAVLLNARLKADSILGRRTIEAKEFFVSALTNALEDGEIVSEIEFPYLPRSTGWGFEEFAQRRGDFAVAAAAVTVTVSNGRCTESRIAVIGGETVIRVPDAEALLQGSTLDENTLAATARTASRSTQFSSDLRASSDFRSHLVKSLTRRALEAAKARAIGKSS